jgi:hypothetical protein
VAITEINTRLSSAAHEQHAPRLHADCMLVVAVYFEQPRHGNGVTYRDLLDLSEPPGVLQYSSFPTAAYG